MNKPIEVVQGNEFGRLIGCGPLEATVDVKGPAQNELTAANRGGRLTISDELSSEGTLGCRKCDCTRLITTTPYGNYCLCKHSKGAHTKYYPPPPAYGALGTYLDETGWRFASIIAKSSQEEAEKELLRYCMVDLGRPDPAVRIRDSTFSSRLQKPLTAEWAGPAIKYARQLNVWQPIIVVTENSHGCTVSTQNAGTRIITSQENCTAEDSQA